MKPPTLMTLLDVKSEGVRETASIVRDKEIAETDYQPSWLIILTHEKLK